MPAIVLRDEIVENLKNLDSKVQRKIYDEFKEKKFFPSFDHVQLAYEAFC